MTPDVQAASEAARALLPAWFGWAPLLVYVPLAWITAFAGISLLVRFSFRPAPDGVDEHWTARTLRTLPARVTVSGGLGAIPALVAGANWHVLGPLSSISPYLLVVLAFGAAMHGALTARRPVAELGPFRGPLRWRLRAFAANLCLRLAGLVVTLATMAAMPATMGLRAVITLAVDLGLMLLIVRGAGVRLASVLGLVQPASPRLAGIVAELTARAGVTPRRVWEVDLAMANAFALVGARELVVTREAMAVLSDEELSAICAHELGHLGEPTRLIAARVIPGLSILLVLAAMPTLVASYGGGALLAIGVVVIGARRVAARLARKMEVRADAVAHGLEADAGVYARALERIYEANGVPAVMGVKGGVHPELYDRLIAAGVTPDYPRPAPPNRRRMFGLLMGGFLLAAVLQFMPQLIIRWMARESPYSVPVQLARASIRGGRSAELASLARAYERQGDLTRSIALLELAGATAQKHAILTMATELAGLLVDAGRCDEARAALSAGLARHNCEGAEETIGEVRESLEECGKRAPTKAVQTSGKAE